MVVWQGWPLWVLGWCWDLDRGMRCRDGNGCSVRYERVEILRLVVNEASVNRSRLHLACLPVLKGRDCIEKVRRNDSCYLSVFVDL